MMLVMVTVCCKGTHTPHPPALAFTAFEYIHFVFFFFISIVRYIYFLTPPAVQLYLSGLLPSQKGILP